MPLAITNPTISRYNFQSLQQQFCVHYEGIVSSRHLFEGLFQVSAELSAQIMQWHEDNEHQQIVDALMKIPPADRDYEMISSMGRAYNNLSLYEKALEQFAFIAEQGKNDPLWYFRVGYSYYYMKRYEEAAGVLRTALELDPGDQHSARLLDWSHSKWQKQQKAESRRTLSRQQKDPGSIPFEGKDLDSFWEDSNYAREQYVSDPPTDELISSVEELGYKLPATYIALMKHQNGGVPHNTSFPTDEAASWAEDHICYNGNYRDRTRQKILYLR
ncbi:MAG: glucan biosynthesis protein [Paenibacillus sp.]|jgi:tetratricopeptide (TPR) repeat protein|nr:glucan biosynthesis protein [Paenibacillus sp.]